MLQDMFERSKTYLSDRDLFKELGLQPFDVKTHEESYIGNVSFENGSYVNLWVTCAPAQFYRAQIYDAEGKVKYEVSTGSGAFENHWPLFKALAQNMLVIDSMEKK